MFHNIPSSLIQASENEREAKTKCNISEDLAADVDYVIIID